MKWAAQRTRRGKGGRLTRLSVERNRTDDGYHNVESRVRMMREWLHIWSELRRVRQREHKRTSANEPGLLSQRKLRDSLIPALHIRTGTNMKSDLISLLSLNGSQSPTPPVSSIPFACNMSSTDRVLLREVELSIRTQTCLDHLSNADLSHKRLVPVPRRVELVSAYSPRKQLIELEDLDQRNAWKEGGVTDTHSQGFRHSAW
jgi:hypothetical protein